MVAFLNYQTYFEERTYERTCSDEAEKNSVYTNVLPEGVPLNHFAFRAMHGNEVPLASSFCASS